MEGEKCRVSDPVPVGFTIYGAVKVIQFCLWLYKMHKIKAHAYS